MKERQDDGEQVGLIGPHQHRHHLPVKIKLGVLGRDQRLELLEPLLVVKKLLPLVDAVTSTPETAIAAGVVAISIHVVLR